VATGLYELAVESPYGDGAWRMPGDGLEISGSTVDTFTIVEGDPLSATARQSSTIAIGRGAWRTRIETTSTMSADATTFYVTSVLNAYEDDTRVFAKTWTFTVPRDFC